MIKIENIEYDGFIPAIRGMRNPMNSWEKSDSGWDTGWPRDHGILIDEDSDSYYECRIGPNDQELMRKLAKAGSVHAKYRRMITVYMDITAPLYWWKEFDTYKVGTVANSCSTMHKIHAKEFTLEDFSHEHLFSFENTESHRHDAFTNSFGVIDDRVAFDKNGSHKHYECLYSYPLEALKYTIQLLNNAREYYIRDGNKEWWWQMIQLLPSSYNQKRTVMLNYEVLSNIYANRKDHKLDEWRIFCEEMKQKLPMPELFTGELKEVQDAIQTDTDDDQQH